MKYARERKLSSPFSSVLKVLLALFSLIIQITIDYFLIFGYNFFEQSNYIFNSLKILIYIYSLILVIRIYNKNFNTSFKLTWTIILLVFPLFGIVIYLFTGNGRSMPKRKTKKIKSYLANRKSFSYKFEKEDQETKNIVTCLSNMTDLNCYKNTNIIFFNDAKKKNDQLMLDLKKAEKYIFLEYFILANGKLLDELYEILLNKSQNGVKIYIIYDDVGSKPTFKGKFKRKFLKIPNLQIRVYAPFSTNANPTINYRDHRKIAVIDGRYAYCGGDNLADEYIHESIRFGYWRDNALRLEGDAVEGFINMFLEMWYMSSNKILNLDEFPLYKHNIKNDALVMPFGDGPTYSLHPSYSLFLNMIASAKKSIYISTPYFIIDKEFINALCRALLKGVEVILLTPSIPDKKQVFYLTREHYKEILLHGAKIYEFNNGFNHAKNIIIDDKYCFVGTINIDYRSFFLHFECGTFFNDYNIIKEIKDDYLKALEYSTLITKENYAKRKLSQRFIAFLLSIFAPLF